MPVRKFCDLCDAELKESSNSLKGSTNISIKKQEHSPTFKPFEYLVECKIVQNDIPETILCLPCATRVLRRFLESKTTPKTDA